MMRLLIVSTEFPPGPGGIGTHAYQVAENLLQRDWSVKVVTPQDYASEGEIEFFNSHSPFPIKRLARIKRIPFQGFYRLGRILETIREYQPHILVASGESSIWLTAFATQFLGMGNIPWVAVWHGLILPQASLRRFSCWAYGKAEAVISVSQYSRDQLVKMGAHLKKEYIIHNGADPSRFFPIAETEVSNFRQLHSPDGSEILLTVGNVTERKGQEIVIRSLPRILERRPLVHYWIAGLPTIKPQLEKLANTLGVSDHVHFLGKLSIQDLLAAYNACDIFVMTSRRSGDGQFEGYGIAVVEAALCGKPAVVSDNSGLLEAINPGETGLVARENDPESTAEIIISLFDDASLRKHLGTQARERALGEQTWSVSIEHYDQALREVLASSLLKEKSTR